MADAVRGPTLMDLKDIVNVDISDVSTIFAFKSFGGLIGTLITGIVLDYCRPSVDYIFLASTFFFKSLTTLLLPYCPTLMAMQAVEFVYGFCHGGFHSVANQLLLRIWIGSGHNSSPYMYALHFFYGIGALITPILSKPFLQTEVESTFNSTMFDVNELELGNDGLWTIKTLYPIIFLIMVIPAPFYIYYFIQENRKEHLLDKSMNKQVQSEVDDKEYLSKKKTILLMFFAAIFYFTMAGVEHGFRTFTAVFCVNSKLGLTKHEAADVLAILYLTFAGVRGLMIPISTLLTSTTILISSSLTLLVSTTMLSIWAESSLIMMQLGIALTGAGIAAMFAAGMLWIQNVVKLNNKITAIICFSCRISEQTYSVISGNLVETVPMGLMYLMSGNVAAVICSLTTMYFIASRR